MKGGTEIAKINRCVVRNQTYRRGEFSIRERHNERKNMEYQNPDVITERAHLNVHFKSCPATYEQEFNRMVESGAISLRGLKKDAKVFDELVFDVNTAYFENHGDGSPAGGYEYAKQFFAEAYRCAVEQVGGERFVLSAVLHADERNRSLSEKLGRDVFHYHLHVVYVPVVDKEIYFKKNNKNPELAGTLREVVKQVSHSKKWPKWKDETGKWINSYSLLQDRFFEHMRAAGFDGFERGERGSTAEHLSVLDYKIKQDKARAAALDKKVGQQRERLSGLQEKTAVMRQTATTFSEIDDMAKKTIGGKYQLTAAEWDTVSGYAKEGVKSRGVVSDLQEKTKIQSREIGKLKSRLAAHGDNQSINDTLQYYQAKQRAPHRMAEVIADIMRQPSEQQPQSRNTTRDKRHDLSL